MIRRWLVVLLAAVVLFLPRPGVAQEDDEEKPAGSATDRAAAQALFNEGRTLLGEERWEEACEKFEKSMALDRAVGTQLNLANCYAKIGKTASAWIIFLEAAAAAKKDGRDDRVKLATEFAAKLEPKLSKIKIVVPFELKGLTITRSGEPIRDAQWDSFVPIDPGEHEIVAQAPGKKPWKKTVKVGDDADQVVVTIGKLEDAPVEPKDEGGMTTTRLALGITAGVVGLAGIAIGSAFGVVAMGKQDESLQHCLAEDVNRCEAPGVTLRDEAISASHVSTIGFAVGGSGLVAALVIFLTAPSSDVEQHDKAKDARLEWSPVVGDGYSGMLVQGSF